MKNILKGGVIGMITLMPIISFGAVRTLKDLIDLVIDYLGYAIPLIMSLSIVVFIYGVYKYFIKVDADREQAGNYILYSVIGFFLMLSFWGLVNIFINTLNLDNNIRGIPFVGGSSRSSGGVNVSNPFNTSGGVNVSNPRNNTSGGVNVSNPDPFGSPANQGRI